MSDAPQDDARSALPVSQEPLRGTAGKFRQRISPQMREVITIMSEEGAPLQEAAKRANITEDAARKAFKRPHVKALYNQLVKDIRENAAQEAYLRIRTLSVKAESEPVRQRANEWIAGVDGLAPLKRVEGKYTHNHQFAGFSFPSEPIDVTPEHDGASSGEDDE